MEKKIDQQKLRNLVIAGANRRVLATAFDMTTDEFNKEIEGDEKLKDTFEKAKDALKSNTRNDRSILTS